VNGVPVSLEDVPFTNSKDTYGATVSVSPVDSPDQGTVTLTGNYSYRSAFFAPNSLPLIEPEGRVPGQGLLNVTLDWSKIMGSNISGQVFARNVLNENYIVGVLSLQEQLGLTTRTYGEPRMYGVTLKYNFGG
jgi:iron complex outermembrane receptor protein